MRCAFKLTRAAELKLGPSLSEGYKPLFFHLHVPLSLSPESYLSVLTQIRCRNCRRKARHSRICNYINRRVKRERERQREEGATVSSFFLPSSLSFCFFANIPCTISRFPSILHKLFITTHLGKRILASPRC